MKTFYKILVNVIFGTVFIFLSLILLYNFIARFAGFAPDHPREYSVTRGNVKILIPDSMRVGFDSMVTVSVIMGNGIAFKKNDPDSTYVIETKTSPMMKANIYDVSGEKLKITPVFSNTEQVVDTLSPTTWKWSVSPLKSGEAQIAVVLSAKINNGIENGYKDFIIHEEYVDVKVSGIRIISDFFKKNWQWLMTIIILPFVLWLRSRILKYVNTPPKRNPIGFKAGK